MRTRRHASPPAIPPMASAPRLPASRFSESGLSESHLSESHLSESQIDDCIIGDLAPAPSAHLALCALCAERVAVASSPLASFQTLSTTWSERLSASLPAPVPCPQKPVWQRHLVLAAPCFVLVLGLTVIRSTYVDNGSQAAQSNPAADSADLASRQSRVSADDQMLDAIEADVNADSDSPADLGLRSISDTSPSSTPSTDRD